MPADILLAMEPRHFKLVKEELASVLTGQRMGRVFQLSRFELVMDLRLSDSRYLFASIEPSAPRTYLIRRRFREIERSAVSPSPFTAQLQRTLAGACVSAVESVKGERVLILRFEHGEGGDADALVIQIAGRSSNMFVLADDMVVAAARPSESAGQRPGDRYHPPPRPDGFAEQQTDPAETAIPKESNISEYLDREYKEKEDERRFASLAAAARNSIRSETKKLTRLISNLKKDLAEHGEPEKWKRYGDLLLANTAAPDRSGAAVRVTDLFDEAMPTIEIEIDETDSIAEAAEKYFRRYTRSRNARSELLTRIETAERRMEKLEARAIAIEEAISRLDLETLTEAAGRTKPLAGRKEKPSKKQPQTSSFARSFTSTDGFEILVGKKAADNDYLTFRAARSLDTWMHAADYPGSHVVIRNPGRKEVPHQTLIEAAQLAGFYSQAKGHPKAAVNYTQKKFVNKPRGAAPGKVSLSRFKTILVEPGIPPGVGRVTQ